MRCKYAGNARTSSLSNGLKSIGLAACRAVMPASYLARMAVSPAAKIRRFWPIAMEAMLGALGLRILLIEDTEATARTLALRSDLETCAVSRRSYCRHLRSPRRRRCSQSLTPSGQPGAANTAEPARL